jgi:hypothetical protein
MVALREEQGLLGMEALRVEDGRQSEVSCISMSK